MISWKEENVLIKTPLTLAEKWELGRVMKYLLDAQGVKHSLALIVDIHPACKSHPKHATVIDPLIQLYKVSGHENKNVVETHL